MKRNTEQYLLAAAISLALPIQSATAMLPVTKVNRGAEIAGVPTSAVETQFLVKYRTGSIELRDSSMLNRSMSAVVSRTGLARALPAAAGRAARSPMAASLLRRTGVPGWNVIKTSRQMNAAEKALFLRELRAAPNVESVEEDRMFTVSASEPVTLNDPDYNRYQWNFFDTKVGVHAPGAWAYSQGEGVVIAVVDTGIALDNPDLKNNVLPGYDMISDPRYSRREQPGRVAGGWDMGNWTEPGQCGAVRDSNWHGTHVAGTIAQEANNGTWGAGLAYKAKVLPVRVIGSCGAQLSDVIDGVVWAAGLEVPGLPINKNPADVINMSLGGPGQCNGPLQTAIDLAAGRGAIIVVAAGNSNAPAAVFSPSSCGNVITVGATGEDGGKSGYSNYGPEVAIAAPGGSGTNTPVSTYQRGIYQLVNGGVTSPEPGQWRTVGYDGTSMAAPHVAAAVAMIQSVAKTPLTTAQMLGLLQSTSTPLLRPLNGSGRSVGAGILNIEAALIKVVEPECYPNCALSAAPLLVDKRVLTVAGAMGEERLYRFNAVAGKPLTIMTYGGVGNVSLSASFGKEPGSSGADARSSGPASVETLRFSPARSGTYFIKLKGETAYSGVSLVARQ